MVSQQTNGSSTAFSVKGKVTCSLCEGEYCDIFNEPYCGFCMRQIQTIKQLQSEKQETK
ncbi:hypothetical protein FB645_003184 [Coemansia sp. IMI 203386]|nr:hypothetical protein FB645_003184 [Coemansia sp. IMI 203386]